jgi:hypothetical protein
VNGFMFLVVGFMILMDRFTDLMDCSLFQWIASWF